MNGSDESKNSEQKNTQGGFASFIQAYRDAAPYLTLGVQLAATVLLLFFMGLWADGKLDTQPWLMLAGLMVGVGVGFYNFFKAVADLSKKQQRDHGSAG